MHGNSSKSAQQCKQENKLIKSNCFKKYKPMVKRETKNKYDQIFGVTTVFTLIKYIKDTTIKI
jgi:hypothetical protein